MNKLNKIAELITVANRVGLVTHRDGDGDAFGSLIGLDRILRQLGKKTVIFSNEPLISQFDFLKSKIDYSPASEYQPVDLLIGTDANSIPRFTTPEIFETAKKSGATTVIIDHHLPNDVGDLVDIYWESQDTSCASEMIFDLSRLLVKRLDKITATVILMGIETDTFSMQFTNTKPKTYEAVAQLLRMGARLRPVVESAFGGKPLKTVKLLGIAIERLETNPQNGWGKTYITIEDKKTLDLDKESSSGVANFLDQVDNLKLVAVFEERDGGKVKVSLRSNNSNINVAELAEKFGGGGHKKAAAYEYVSTIENAKRDFEKIEVTKA